LSYPSKNGAGLSQNSCSAAELCRQKRCGGYAPLRKTVAPCPV